MFSRITVFIVLAVSAVLVAAAPTAVNRTPTVTVRDVSGSDAAPVATSKPADPLSGLLGPLGDLSGSLAGITGTLTGTFDDVTGGLLGGLTGGKGLGGLGAPV